MTTLTEFLLARIAEDEAAARAVAPLGHNFDMGGNRQDERFSHRRYSQASEDGMPRLRDDEAATAHFARHDPARVLAECEAKRRIVQESIDYSPELEHGDNGEWAFDGILRVLAAFYANHPDYRDEWKP